MRLIDNHFSFWRMYDSRVFICCYSCQTVVSIQKTEENNYPKIIISIDTNDSQIIRNYHASPAVISGSGTEHLKNLKDAIEGKIIPKKKRYYYRHTESHGPTPRRETNL